MTTLPGTERGGATARHVHLLTPGDHFSPRTGSAVPTVVHGLSAATPAGAPRPAVLVARGTYADRYDSADSREYPLRPERGADRYVDPVLGRLGLGRPGARRRLAPALAGQGGWEPSVVLAHNLPQAVRLVDPAHHAAVLYAHNQLLRTYSPREAARTLGGAAAIVCVSDHLAEATRQALPRGLRDRVVVVRNGVDVAAFTGAPRTPHPTLRVVFIGRTIPEKGPDVLVRAVRDLGREDVELEVVGGAGFAPQAPLTPYEHRLRELAAGHPRITFRRFVDRSEVRRVLAGADVAVVPSRWPDPCPLTVLEGMAAGAAVVGSDVGGIPETVHPAGILVPPDDPASLAEVLDALAADRTLLDDVARRCRAYAVEHSWTATRRELDAALAGVLAGALR